jgi:RHS repeat-associated protein
VRSHATVFWVSNCTESAFATAFNSADVGDTVRFACDGTIPLSTSYEFSWAITLDGSGHNVTLSGGGSVRPFVVDGGANATFTNLTIANGFATDAGGAIYNYGNLVATSCTFTNNRVVALNGAPGGNGTDGSINGNNGTGGTAGGSACGGAIYNLGTASLTSCTFRTNTAQGGVGGVSGNGGNGAGNNGGNASTAGAGGAALGSAIYNLGTLSVSLCQYLTNFALAGNGGNGGHGGNGLYGGGNGGTGGAGGFAFGGGIYCTNRVAVTNCYFVGNQAVGGAGGNGGTNGSGGSSNGAEGPGGLGAEGSGAGMYVACASTVVGSTFYLNIGAGGSGGSAGGYSGNLAYGPSTGADGAHGGPGLGGGLCNRGTNAALDCTFYDNLAGGGAGGNGGAGSSTGGNGGIAGTGGGGGLYNAGRTGVTNCTASSSGASGGAGGVGGSGGAFNGSAGGNGAVQGDDAANSGGSFTLKNSILAYGLTGGHNGYDTIIDAGNNISSDTSISLTNSTSHSNTDPLLGSLADNGGPTKTCALLAGSPAIDAGSTAAAPSQDQRGYFRWGTPDIGSYEYGNQGLEVLALGPYASLDRDVGLFTIDTGFVSTGPLAVNYVLSGTASNGVDYVQITNSATIPAGEPYVNVLVRGIPGAFSATNKTVVLTLLPSSQYFLSTSSTNTTITLLDHSTFDSSKRFVRGTATAPDFQSFVIPLNFQTGVRLDPTGGNATNLFPGNQWTNTLYHYNATNAVPQPTISNRLAFQNPIVAFGSPVGGSALYLNQSYIFGVFGGSPLVLSNALRIQVYYRSNSALAGSIILTVPDVAKTNQLTGLVTNGFTQTFQGFGLTTVLLMSSFEDWGLALGQRFTLTHTATTAATNYYYVLEEQGYVPSEYTVLNQSGLPDWSRLYAMEFSPFPAGRSTFVDQPHFDGAPLPPAYQGKTVQELTNITATLPNLSSLVPSNYLTLDASPELRRHPILDQFVADMGNDPLALANYVINEIDLTDALDYDTNYNSQPAVNLGGVDRSALATFQEGQGSPAEQCALLVYLLRQAGVPAAYVYPTNGGLQMLDFQVSKLLRTQLRGAVNFYGQTNLPQVISVNYPWVAAYIGTNWVQVFPWLKDTEISEGFDLYDYMPTNYNSGYKWLTHFIANDTNIFSLSASDQPLDLLPLFIQNSLNANYPGMSVDDLGVQIRNRRHLYAQWTDFPKPFSITGPPLAIESLKTNLNLFNTIEVRAYSQANPSKFIDTGELPIADVHNRMLLLKFLQVGTNNVHNMILSLAAYSSNVTSQAAFSTNADPTWKLVTTNQLNSTDDTIVFQITHRKLKFLASGYAAPEWWGETNLWGYNYSELGEQQPGKVYQLTDTFRKGDLVAFCFDTGKVSQKMLNVHAQEIWQFNQNADTNNPATLDPDIYQGTVAYLLGMSYYNYLDKFLELDNRLHKEQMVSYYAQGYGLLRPLRDSTGALPTNGVVILTTPAVHMPDLGGHSLLFDGTTKPNSGQDIFSTSLGWGLHYGLAASAAEHAALRSFYVTNAISSVKLLQQAGTNTVTLNADNYLTNGEVLYHGVKLKNADPALWTTVTNFLTTGDFDSVVFITPGTMTNGTYIGAGALLVSASEVDSPVSGLNGGYAYQFANTTWSSQNSPNLNVYPAPADSATTFYLQSSSTANNSGYLVNGATASWTQPATDTQLANGQVQLDPSWLQAETQQSAMYGTAANSASAFNQGYNLGDLDTENSARGDKGNFIAEPVEAMTGEFYVDSTDLTLPGPMPLQVRRNYGSQNLAENEFGFGWKISYVPFLSQNTNSTLMYAAEMDGSTVAYRQSATNSSLWFPQPQDNRTLNNNSSQGIGSVANLFNNRLTLSTATGTNVYTLTGADGSIRTFALRSYPIGTFTRQRPYLDRWQASRGNFYLFQYGADPTQPDYGKVRRVQSSNGNFFGFYYDVYGHIIEAYTGDGRRLHYDYDKFGDLLTVTLPDESQLEYLYQHSNYVTNGVTNVYSTHLIVQELKPDGRALKNDYDSLRRVTNQYATVGIDLSLVRNATFLYTNNFALGSTNLLTGTTTILDYTNHPTTYFYTNSLIRTIVDSLNQTNVQDWYEADTAGGFRRSLKSRTDKRHLQTTLLYDTFGNVTNTTVTGDLLGDGSTVSAVSTATYNTNNLPLQITDPATNSVTVIYDPTFPFLPQQAIKYAGVAAISTNFSLYVSVTNVVTLGSIQQTNIALGVLQRTIRAYNSPDAATNDTFRDGRGFVTNAVQYTGTGDPNVTNNFIVNTRGETVQRIDGAGRIFVSLFDPLGRPAGQETYNPGQSQPMDWGYVYYNLNGEPWWSDGPRFNPEDYVWRDYDGAGRETTELRWRSEAKSDGSGVQAPADGALFATTFNQFDPFGNNTQTTDPNGNYKVRRFDAIGQMTNAVAYNAASLPLATNGIAYEPGGLPAYATNALGGVTIKRYSSRGQPEFQQNPDGSTNGWTYYLDGRIKREYQCNGAFWESTYDDVNRKATRVFHAASGASLATESAQQDRRGNPISRVDRAGFAFTNSWDGLDRVKVTAGPPIVTVYLSYDFSHYVTNTVQQMVTTAYAIAGTGTTNINALGEKTITLFDALGRPTRFEIRTAANALVRESSKAYSADHQSVTSTNGSGGSAIVSTAFTDNIGNLLLAIGYPSSGVQEFTRRAYDLAGNNIFEGRYSSSAGAVTPWTTASFGFDGQNFRIAETNRDNAVTLFNRDAMGNETNRVLPGGLLSWNAAYNNAGQELKDWNASTAGGITRSNSSAYYPAGHPCAGLLQTSTDGRGVSCLHLYDDWLRPVTNIYTGPLPEHNLTAFTLFDLRGFPFAMGETFTNGTIGPPTLIQRSNDANGLLFSETVSADGSYYVSANDNFDSAGRRIGLGMSAQSAGFNYSFGWQADGLLSSIFTQPGGGNNYAYTTAGLLTSRSIGSRYTSIDSRDGVGRPLSITTTMFGFISALTESLAWTGDGLLSSHTLWREDFTDSRSYAYASQSRRLTTEALNLDGAKRWTNNFLFDGGAAAGPGVLTKVAESSSLSSSNAWSGATDNFSRVSAETNTFAHRLAYGRLNGPATVTVSVDGQPVPAALNYTTSHDWTNRWSATLELAPGAHQITASAQHPSGMFTTNASIWITNNASYEAVADTYDAAGFTTQRAWKSPNGTTNRTQTLTWSARGRLLKVSERDSANNGQDWTCVYDPLGRRLQTTQIIVTNGVSLTNQPIVVSHYFDPMVEFLELGQTERGRTTWKLMGPDMDGRYGGQNGTGGFEAIVPGPDLFCPVVSDCLGNVLAVYDGSHADLTWSASRPTGYGAVPGYRPITPGSSGSNILSLVMETACRDRITESIGLTWLGANWYDPVSGQFVSPDALGHDSSPSLYSFCQGNPLDYWDPDGRCVNGAIAGWNSAPVPANASSAFMAGYYSGGVTAGFGEGWNEGSAIVSDTATFGQVNSLHSYTSTLQGGVYDWSRGFAAAGVGSAALATGGAILEASPALYVGAATASANPWAYVAAGGAISGYESYRQGASAGDIAASAMVGAGMTYAYSPFPITGNNAPSQIVTGSPRAGQLPSGEEPYQLLLFPDQPYDRVAQYGNTPTAAQRASVPAGMEFDHTPPLVQHYYEGPGDGTLPGFNLTQTERVQYGANLQSGSAATPAAQRAQGGASAQYSRQQKSQWGF